MRVTADGDTGPSNNGNSRRLAALDDNMGPSNGNDRSFAALDEDDQMGNEAQDTQDMEVGHTGSLEPDFDDFVGEMLLASVASSGRR